MKPSMLCVVKWIFLNEFLRFHRSLISIKCSCEVTNAFTPQLTILVGIINSLFNCIPLSCLTKIFCCSKIFCCFSPSNLADAINNELRNRESWCQKYSKTKDQIWTKFMSSFEREKKMSSNIQIYQCNMEMTGQFWVQAWLASINRLGELLAE